MQPSDYQHIGQYLRDSRESLHVSLGQAAAALHIRAKYLDALECGDLQGLPGKSYTRGYIRNYAHYLGLDVEQVCDAYDALLGPKISELFIPEQTLKANQPSAWLFWVSISGLILLYCFWYFGFHDRSLINRSISELPAAFAHLLDKTPAPAMDKPWKDCLSGEEDEICYIQLRAQELAFPDLKGIYDIDPAHLPPQEP